MRGMPAAGPHGVDPSDPPVSRLDDRDTQPRIARFAVAATAGLARTLLQGGPAPWPPHG